MREDRGNDLPAPEPVLMGVPDSSFVADRQLMAAPSAAARQHGAAVLRFHPGPESMSLGALTIVRLKRSLGHLFS